MSPKKPLDRIKSGALARTMALAKLTVSAGARAASHAVGNVFAGEDTRAERTRQMLQAQAISLVRELGQLKGSAMKVGQMLSMYGEHFLPPEVNTLLKSLQHQSPPLRWEAIYEVLQREWSADALASVEVEPQAMAAASLGQVHRARRRADGRQLAIKVQYPGMDAAIEGDLRTFRRLLSMSKLLPRQLDTDGVFEEVRAMLVQEADYAKELQATRQFGDWLADDPRYIVPEPIAALSSRHVLTTTFEDGYGIDSPTVLGLPQADRDALGTAFIDLYMRELWEFNHVQTDPHFGNYRVRLNEGAPPRLVAYDFGAVRAVPPHCLSGYRKLVTGACLNSRDDVFAGGKMLGFLRDGDDAASQDVFFNLCRLIVEPFLSVDEVDAEARPLFDDRGAYHWGRSDLPKRLVRKGAQAAIRFELRSPPRESIFLDRKLGGVFVVLSVLQVQIKARDVLQRYVTLG